ncbi:flavin monoamine oxidase family protein [Streptomyces boluensis]|uniref:FAD-dependent oxidoreductase n=1 Tax=Streptomyces boluensis TaxID=1775135 RepID=A0A964UKT9_9ACTN|nr:NAD(P)/FAD-dependent oxidoreductase [Streptomyces boluensis]NBE49925.1 FAD-dependent oxidoreductase [Streptomyces boluensis]
MTAVREFDAIVVGAGFAGVTAARELRARGLRPVVIEARHRIGGRTWTDTFDGLPIEYGGGWISPFAKLAMAELDRYDIPLLEGVLPMPEWAVFPVEDGSLESFDGNVALGRLGELLTTIFEGSEKLLPRPHEPLFAGERIRAVAGQSLRERLDSLHLDTRDDMWISTLVGGFAGGSSKDGAYEALAQWWQVAGGKLADWITIEGQAPASGMSALVQEILNDAEADLHLNSPVTRVDDDGSLVRVTTASGREFAAPVAVLAVPANVWRTIDFRPGLPPVHAETAERGIGVPHTSRLWLRVRGDFGPVHVRDVENGLLTPMFTHAVLDNGEQLLTGYSQDPSLDVSRPEQVRAALQRLLPQAELISYRAHDWGHDPYSLGGWTLRRPGQLTQLPEVQEPHGRVAFANDGIASGWNGFVDGAIESGFRAAGQAADIAGK